MLCMSNAEIFSTGLPTVFIRNTPLEKPRSKKQEARSRKQEAGSEKQEAGSEKQEARSRKQGAGNEEQGTGNGNEDFGKNVSGLGCLKEFACLRHRDTRKLQEALDVIAAQPAACIRCLREK